MVRWRLDGDVRGKQRREEKITSISCCSIRDVERGSADALS